MKKYQSYINQLETHLFKKDESRFLAQQLLRLHKETELKPNPLIVELGVDRGQSTRVFLNAIDGKQNAKLISIDIKDYSEVCSSSKWHFIKSNSLDIDYILKNEPDIVNKGIDILYIDSFHTREHVQNELYLYYPYLNQNAVIFFDDVDSGPYMINQRKDSISTEIENRSILDLINSVFYTNKKEVNLNIYKGSTGLARMEKLSIKGKILKTTKRFYKRRNKILWKIIYFLLRKRKYSP